MSFPSSGKQVSSCLLVRRDPFEAKVVLWPRTDQVVVGRTAEGELLGGAEYVSARRGMRGEGSCVGSVRRAGGRCRQDRV